MQMVLRVEPSICRRDDGEVKGRSDGSTCECSSVVGAGSEANSRSSPSLQKLSKYKHVCLTCGVRLLSTNQQLSRELPSLQVEAAERERDRDRNREREHTGETKCESFPHST